MAPTTLWPVVGSLGAAVGTLALGWVLRDRRGRPGASWLLAVLGVQFVLTLGYGFGYLVFDPTLRLAVEMLFWVSYIWLGALFVAFGLAYTGRGHVIRSPWFGTLVALSLALTALVVTNPIHHVVWTNFRVAPTAGLATVQFTRKAGALLLLVVAALGASVGTLLLVDTIISYGTLYRAEALAVAVSPLPPGIGFVLWAFAIAPIPGLNVAPVLFLVHVGVDAYAFVGSGMFDFHPATRRAGNRAAIADLGNPVVVVDEHHRVVNVNPAAKAMFDVTDDDVLTRPFTDCYQGEEIEPALAEQVAEISVDRRTRVFKVTSTRLYDSTDTHLGYTLVFQDITAERQREQRLAVLNRVLRHNLRNDLTVVRMHVDEAADRADDEIASLLDPAESKIDGLVALSGKARRFERVIDEETESLVAVPDIVGSVVDDIRAAHPEVDIEIQGVDSAILRTNASLLELLVENLVENAVEHGSTSPDSQARQDAVEHGSTSHRSQTHDDAVEHGSTSPPSQVQESGAEHSTPDETHTDADTPDVTVTVDADEHTVTLTVADRGPGIPEHELAVLEGGDESALEHGSGLGLWLVRWSVTAIGGDLDFETSTDGTTVTVTLPVVEASE